MNRPRPCRHGFRPRSRWLLSLAVSAASSLSLGPPAAPAEVCNLKVLTDASPDYHDLSSMVRSMTSRWATPAEKCWAVFYWNHIARRQTQPMVLHGMALTDPIRQFNDYGFAMCSTVAGINCRIWHEMGLPARYWDVTAHTVSEVQYDGRWHLYDNSMSALYTLCDGKTIAGVEDVGKVGACPASGGREEPGHIARYHCLHATSPNGYLTGADCIRSLEEEYRCFNPNGLKHRTYFMDWDEGHRYILNLRPGEAYTRYYHSLGDGPGFFVPNEGKDPESVNPRYRIRGNGVWVFRPPLAPGEFQRAAHDLRNIAAGPDGLRPAEAGSAGEIIYKIHSANVTASQQITATFQRKQAGATAAISISADNGRSWKPVWEARGDASAADVKLIDEVNGAYETLIKVALHAPSDPADITLRQLEVRTTTALNSKTQPRLNVGRNTIYVGAGDQTDSTVFWPELQNDRYKRLIVEEKNVASVREHPGYQGAVHPARANEDAWLVYRLDAPRDLRRISFGGRFYNRAPRSHIDLLYSLDEGNTWTRSWSLNQTDIPWDVIHYEAVDVPPGHRSVQIKYLMNTPDASPSGCSIYAVRLEAHSAPIDPGYQPVEVTFTWKERQKDRSLVQRSHTERIDKVPAKYIINVGGEDHPVMESLAVGLKGAGGGVRYGYSDGRDAGGERYVGRWVTPGRNLAVGKSYTLSAPSQTSWEAGDPDGRKLTDGIVGPSYAGGTSYRSGALWNANTNPVITLDLGRPESCAAFGLNFHGYEWWDALAGQVTDRVEVRVSADGSDYRSLGFLNTDLRWQDLPVNFMWPDDEALTGATFRLIPEQPTTTARFVQYRVTSQRIFCATEVEVLDSIRSEPFDLRLALPE